MLLEALFCIGFFLLPLVGMLALIIKAALRAEEPKKIREKLNLSRFRKRRRVYPALVFENHEVVDYQLIESKVHKSLHLNKLKGRVHPRAGP